MLGGMDMQTFMAIVAAVLVGNAFTGLVVYTTWRATKAEKRGLPASSLPLGLLLITLVPFAIVIGSVALLHG